MIGQIIPSMVKIKIRPKALERFVQSLVPPRLPGYVWFIVTNNYPSCIFQCPKFIPIPVYRTMC